MADASPTAGTAVSSLKFGACPDQAGAPRGVACATLKVPLDYAKPNGKQITLTVSGTGSLQAEHFLLVNPGGPGSPGIGTEKLVFSQLPEAVADKYAVFSFDPRGVGVSTPITCGRPKELAFARPAPAYQPANDAAEQYRVEHARRIAKSCAAHAKNLPYITVPNEVRDMERIRIALGKDKIDYLGYSAGSILGATYATMYPTHTGRMILDSVVDPTTTDYGSAFVQDPALEKRFGALQKWVAARDRTYHFGTTSAAVRKTWKGMRKQLIAHPAGGRSGGAELDDLLASSTYDDASWPDLMSALKAYRQGDSGELLAATDQLEEASVDPGQLAYNCSQPGWPTNWKTWHRDTVRANRTSPTFAWLNTWYSAPCAFWPVPPVRSAKIGSVPVPPILLLQSTDDAATPLSGAQHMRAALPNSRLLVRPGGNHASYLFGKNTCIDKKAANYWLTGALPADAKCKA